MSVDRGSILQAFASALFASLVRISARLLQCSARLGGKMRKSATAIPFCEQMLWNKAVQPKWLVNGLASKNGYDCKWTTVLHHFTLTFHNFSLTSHVALKKFFGCYYFTSLCIVIRLSSILCCYPVAILRFCCRRDGWARWVQRCKTA